MLRATTQPVLWHQDILGATSTGASLEHFQKCCNHSVEWMERERDLFELGLRFGSVTGFCKPAPSPKLKNLRSELATTFFQTL
jgi:hypothetical protein